MTYQHQVKSYVAMNSRQFINVNLALGAFAAIANGGATMMTLGDSARWSAAQIGEATLFASIGVALVVIGALAIAGRISLLRALAWQAAALASLLCLLILWGVTILLGTAEQPLVVSWMVGILSGLAIYLIYLVRRADEDRFQSLRTLLLALCGVAIVIDIGVFTRVGWF